MLIAAIINSGLEIHSNIGKKPEGNTNWTVITNSSNIAVQLLTASNIDNIGWIKASLLSNLGTQFINSRPIKQTPQSKTP